MVGGGGEVTAGISGLERVYGHRKYYIFSLPFYCNWYKIAETAVLAGFIESGQNVWELGCAGENEKRQLILILNDMDSPIPMEYV